ncbi:GIY-YIG nuclease family protein [Microbacterium sp. KSW4-11]|uniref:GIY-YIG nuclease family protein n=1 Tax=Microbacterium gawkjiense TaxID=3067309 RepID=A0ABU3GD13_9MICO|nr:GIY-YIG nuclease family protein [Microbacterium sp. KSW4-11]MDT3317699.1 GIY-YIG nuclease family protein [Microbacterium sp. KSW4-11]
MPYDAAEAVPPLSPTEEIANLIRNNDGRLGEVFRLDEQGFAPDAIAQQLNVATVGFVYSYRTYANAALHGKVPGGSTLRKATLSSLNSLVKAGRDVLSRDAMQLLLAHRSAVEAAELDAEPTVQEVEDNEQQERDALSTLERLRGVPGIYAFSYGWYLESPVDEARGNTLIKVGRAEDVSARIKQHSSGARAHMPEPLALLRVYSVETPELVHTERMFHQLLDTAGHGNPRRRGLNRSEVGKEWFLTNEDFLDAVAKALKLTTLYIGRSEFADE